MSSLDHISLHSTTRSRAEILMDRLSLGLAAAMMLLGLRQWAIIVGLAAGPGGGFETMPQIWQLATMHLGVVDLIAAVGLWLRSSWGRVVWIVAAVSEVAMHSVFIGTFGANFVIVAFHAAALAAMLVTWIGVRRAAKANH